MNALSKNKTNKLRRRTPRKTFEDLILPEEVLATLLRLKREHDRRAALARNNIKPRNRILFYGPPGNGKTASAEALANLLELDFYLADYSAIVDSFHGGTEKAVVELFDAVASSSCLIMFDEADSILASRVSAGQACDRANNNATNLLLTRLDELSPNVVFVAATNRVHDLDAAAARRFDLSVEFRNPGHEEKVTFATRLMKAYPMLKGNKSKADAIVRNAAADNFAELEKAVIDHARQAIVGD